MRSLIYFEASEMLVTSAQVSLRHPKAVIAADSHMNLSYSARIMESSTEPEIEVFVREQWRI
jgi:hypothetical protein